MLDALMAGTQKKIQYLAEIGRRGGLASRRELTRSHAKQMVAIREAKRAALERSLGGGGDPMTPASFLNRSADVTFLTDLTMR